MYFCFGWPKLFTGPEPTDKIVDIKYNNYSTSAQGVLIASITPGSISIWSGDQHRVLLGYVQQTEEGLEKYGKNKEVVWSPQSVLLAVLTDKGCVLFYRVKAEQKDLTEFKFSRPYHYIQLGCKFQVSCEFRNAFIDQEVQAECIAGVEDFLVVCTKDGNVFHMLWNGNITYRVFPSNLIQGSLPNNVCVVYSTYSKNLKTLALVLSSGAAALVQLDENGTLEKASGHLLPVNNAICIALNHRNDIVAVGCENGETNLYYIREGKFARTLSMSQWGITAEDTGPVCCLEWTPDYSALAIGWFKRGLSVWSIHGCRLMCTIPQLEGSFSRPVESSTREPLRGGVHCICWGPEGYHLQVGCKGAAAGKLMQFSFVKSCLATNPNLSGCEKMLLQGEDRILLLSYIGRELDDITWNHLQVPHTYLSDNWPIRYVNVSSDGSLIAVAGKRGVTLYSTITKRWKLFGDRTQEQQVICQGLAWYRHILAVANYNAAVSTFELLFYPKNHLDHSSLLYKCSIPQRKAPCLLDCNENYLIVLTTDSHLYQYLIIPEYTGQEINSLRLQLLHQSSMIGPIGSAVPPLSVALLPSAIKAGSSASLSSAKCLVLNSSGFLSLANVEESILVNLASSVEQFWVANYSHDADKDLGNTLWAYGQSGLQVWFPFFSSDTELQATKLMSRDKSLEFDLEVYPIGFVPELGVIVGLTQEIVHTISSDYACFELKIKTHPFLHSILRHLIREGDESKALHIARNFSFIPHFAHSLELLLHETLDDEKIDTKNLTTSTHLQHVVKFLSQFPQFPDIVMRCARKTDPIIWKQLFSLAGSPKKLFEQCVATKRLMTAASYLRILQLLDGQRESRQCALTLLEEALGCDDLSLSEDLMRFLEPPDFLPDFAPKKLSHRSSYDLAEDLNDVEPDDQDYYHQELLLARYARKLLLKYDLLKLNEFARRVSRDLKPWLARERRRAAAIEDYEAALAKVHLQFQIPYPSVADLMKGPLLPPSGTGLGRSESSNQVSSHLKISDSGSQPFSPTMSIVTLQKMFLEMQNANCVHWSLVIATVLLDRAQVQEILHNHLMEWKPYYKMLSNQECEGYKVLAGDLDKIFHKYADF
eukprot:TRINITY_DN2172_c0_g1_i3.p1 TRINITY_DN2172_c0_g1~~TRINITY_DN2172_c0_g1_i3.p1  ORF type:complete len:1105 (-),score=223.56 TRINITY_DN2172_c0_g1_i3:255-3569(-)